MNNPKFALSQALQGLADVARIIDSDDYDPNNVVIQRAIKQMLLDLKLPSNVDNCFQFQKFLKASMAHCDDIVRDFKAKKKRFDETLANFRNATRLKMEAGEKLEGNMCSITISDRDDDLYIAFETDTKGSVSEGMIQKWNIPLELLRPQYVLNKTAIRDFLKTGEKLPWAEFQYKKSLRFNPRGSARGKK